MNSQYLQAAEREFPFADDDYVTAKERAAYIKACEHMEAAASELVRALEKIARQKTRMEFLNDPEFLGGDFEGAYDTLIEIARKALANYPKVGEEGKEAKEFIRWVRLEGWEHTPNELNCWHRSFRNRTEFKTEDELYQLFKQNPQP